LYEACLEAWHWIVALNDLGSSTYLHWQLAASKRSNHDPLGVALVQFNIDNATFYIPKKYYFVKQFSRFIQPGMVRINMSGLPIGVLGTAFHDGAHASGVAVLENLNSTAQSLRLSWPGADTLAVWRSSRADTCIQLQSLVRSGSYFDLTFPDSSIVTLTGPMQSPNQVIGADQPPEFSLSQNYPNPFNPGTTIEFKLRVQSDFTLTIFDILGRKVRTFEYQRAPAGTHKLEWDGKDDSGRPSASGVYLYRVQAGQNVETQRMLLLK
jgi:hypothetical protein